MGAAAILGSGSGFAMAGTAAPTAPAADQEDPLAAFDAFIGNWQFPEEFIAENAWAAEFYARTWSWGPARAIVRLGETVHKATPDRRVFEGFAYWHPVEQQVRFAGYNVQQKFYFEGHYPVLEADRIVREYTVHYPADFEHDTFADMSGPTRTYMGELRLIDDDTLEGTTYIRVNGEWRRWPTADASPFRLTRGPL